MSQAATLDPVDPHHFEMVPANYPSFARFGMIIFLGSESMLFTGLIGTYIILRISAGDSWVPHDERLFELKFPLTQMNCIMIFNTINLISSSFVYHFAEVAVKKGKSAASWLFGAAAMGTLFLCIQAWEWHHLYEEGMWFGHPGFNGYGSSFFVLTGFHGFHVCIGVILILWSFCKSITGGFTPHRHILLGNAGIYWHFVDVVWVLLFSLLYFDLAWQVFHRLLHAV